MKSLVLGVKMISLVTGHLGWLVSKVFLCSVMETLNICLSSVMILLLVSRPGVK